MDRMDFIKFLEAKLEDLRESYAATYEGQEFYDRLSAQISVVEDMIGEIIYLKKN